MGNCVGERLKPLAQLSTPRVADFFLPVHREPHGRKSLLRGTFVPFSHDYMFNYEAIEHAGKVPATAARRHGIVLQARQKSNAPVRYVFSTAPT